jgi:hypothetical protein
MLVEDIDKKVAFANSESDEIVLCASSSSPIYGNQLTVTIPLHL